MKYLKTTLLALAIATATAACAGHAHHHGGAKSVRVLESEHRDRTVIIVNARPARSRQCWRHGGHWHCRR